MYNNVDQYIYYASLVNNMEIHNIVIISVNIPLFSNKVYYNIRFIHDVKDVIYIGSVYHAHKV